MAALVELALEAGHLLIINVQNDLTRANETGRDHPWDMADAPEDFVHGLTRAVVGLRLKVARPPGLSVAKQPASEKRHYLLYSLANIAE